MQNALVLSGHRVSHATTYTIQDHNVTVSILYPVSALKVDKQSQRNLTDLTRRRSFWSGSDVLSGDFHVRKIRRSSASVLHPPVSVQSVRQE